jgi:transcriptional regulator with XRE-family HTH domain
MENRVRIGNLMASIRESKGMTQRQMAEKCGVTFQNISKIENGRYNVGVDVLSRMAEALGYEVTIARKAAE